MQETTRRLLTPREVSEEVNTDTRSAITRDCAELAVLNSKRKTKSKKPVVRIESIIRVARIGIRDVDHRWAGRISRISVDRCLLAASVTVNHMYACSALAGVRR